MKIILQNERPVSWNQFYSGAHWSKRSSEAERVHKLVAYSQPLSKWTMFKKKVDIFITAFFKNRPYDSDNIMGKLYVDALKGYAIKDDTPEYVGYVGTKSEIDKTNPRLEIEIHEEYTNV